MPGLYGIRTGRLGKKLTPIIDDRNDMICASSLQGLLGTVWIMELI